MKRLLSIAGVLMCIVFLLAGCGTYSSKGITYSIGSEGNISVNIDSSDKYDIKNDSNEKSTFNVYKGDEKLSTGLFVGTETYEKYCGYVKSDSKSKIIKTSENNDIEYLFYTYDNSEFNYIIKIKNSSVGIILGNNHSQDEAEEVFKRLSFKVE